MSFGSVGGKFDLPNRSTARFLNLHGQLYHRAASLHPNANMRPSFAQLYVLDTDIAMRERMDYLNQNNQQPMQEVLTQEDKIIISQVSFKLLINY